MPQISLDQALFLRPDCEHPQPLAHSAGFDDAWLPAAEKMMIGFGERPDGMRCPLTVFARLLTARHVAVVRVIDDAAGQYPTGLRFHFLIISKKDYVERIRDPFRLAHLVEPTWEARGTMPALMIPAEAFMPRTVAQLESVLKRIKACALREGEDPEAADFVRTAENSESPALLGGAQILVDGGRLIFERPQGDLSMVSGLWLLLPEVTRVRLWPTSFAFSRDLEFDVLVTPHVDHPMQEGYTTEEQAADYPAGSYELELQTAVESGNQRDLDAVLCRRDGQQTIRLGILLLVVVSVLVFLSRWINPAPIPDPRPVPAEEIAAFTGIVAVGDPWTAVSMLGTAKMVWGKSK
jgi:hypothetical protein